LCLLHVIDMSDDPNYFRRRILPRHGNARIFCGLDNGTPRRVVMHILRMRRKRAFTSLGRSKASMASAEDAFFVRIASARSWRQFMRP